MSGRHRRAGPPVDTREPQVARAETPIDIESQPGADWPTEVLEPVPAMSGRGGGPQPAVAAGAAAPAPARHSHARAAAPKPAAPATAVAGLALTSDRTSDLTSDVAGLTQPGSAPLAPASPPAAGMGTAAEAIPVLPAAGDVSSRRVQRQQRRQRARRVRWIAAAVVVVLALAVTAFFVTHGSGGTGSGGSPTANARSQSTLLVRVVDPHGQAYAGVLLGHTTTGQGTGFGALLPRNLEVTVPGSGTTTLANASTVAGQSASANAVADALGVVVDGSWTLTSAGLAGLVNSVGGLDVTVDRNVVSTRGGGTVVEIPAGLHHLNGAQAALYATYLAAGEPEQQRLVRFSNVFQALLSRLPHSSGAQSAILAQAGAGSVSTLPPSRLASMLSGLRSDASGGRLSFNDVPITTLDAATGSTVLSVNPALIKSFVQTNFAGSLPPSPAGGPARVLVQNGVGTPGLGASARNHLVGAGLTYVAGGNASQFGRTKSLILVNDASSRSLEQGQETARALRLPYSDIRINPSGQSVADVIVILGADYRP